jgi:hypothetical protein
VPQIQFQLRHVFLDGVEISHVTSGIGIDIAAGDIPRVTLHIVARYGVIVAENGDVHIHTKDKNQKEAEL